MTVSRTTPSLLAGSHAGDTSEHVMRLAEIGFQSSAMVHDLNNLLQIVVGNLDFASQGRLDDKAARHLALARTAIERCTRLARRTLSESRRVDDVRLVRLSDALDDMSERFRTACGEGVVVSIRPVAPDIAVAVDEPELENALLNLVVNARDAMSGRGTIRIECDAEPERVMLKVEDDGPGIPLELHGAVLERFFTTKANGTGLGLANVRAFAEAAGGGLALDSRPGRGITATLSFPRMTMAAHLPDPGLRLHVA